MKRTGLFFILVFALVVSTGCATMGVKPEPPASVISPEDAKADAADKAKAELSSAEDALDAAQKQVTSQEGKVTAAKATAAKAYDAYAEELRLQAEIAEGKAEILETESAKLRGEAPAPSGNVEIEEGEFYPTPQEFYVDISWDGKAVKRLTPYPEGWKLMQKGKQITLFRNDIPSWGGTLPKPGKYRVTLNGAAEIEP